MIRLKNKSEFWKHIKISESGCWDWKGSRHPKGYGQVYLYGDKYKTHRLAYEIVHGEITNDMCVCHKCDNPSCCKPGHLFLGTNYENVQDSTKKRRRVKQYGELNHNAILTKKEVLEIREKYKKGMSRSDLSFIFDVSKPSIYNITTYRSWKSI